MHKGRWVAQVRGEDCSVCSEDLHTSQSLGIGIWDRGVLVRVGEDVSTCLAFGLWISST